MGMKACKYLTVEWSLIESLIAFDLELDEYQSTLRTSLLQMFQMSLNIYLIKRNHVGRETFHYQTIPTKALNNVIRF